MHREYFGGACRASNQAVAPRCRCVKANLREKEKDYEHPTASGSNILLHDVSVKVRKGEREDRGDEQEGVTERERAGEKDRE